VTEVKIVPVVASNSNKRKSSEGELAELVNAGWVVVAAGATFVTLQRERPGAARQRAGRQADDSATHYSQRVYRDKGGLERLAFFSDAVFAIAITLLALEIRLPETTSDSNLLAALGSIWEQYLGYGISFLVIGMYWTAHHRTFRELEAYTDRLLLLNLLLLLLVGFVPFPTAVISSHSGTVGTIFYAVTMTAVGVMLAFFWWYVQAKSRLLPEPLEGRFLRRTLARALIAPAVFLTSIPIALWNPDLAKWSWILIGLGFVLYHPRRE
jgi:uncharacterized membrane protein